MKSDLGQFKEKVEKRAKSRERKKKPKMKVSGKSVFKLRKMISQKTKA